MSRIKKMIAAMLVSVLASGFALTAYAGENVMREPAHTHAFSINYTCYKSYTATTHPYVSGYKVDANGNTTPVYDTCGVVVYFYIGEWKCACGATNGFDETQKTKHFGCGQKEE